jgi:hypothetical protein
MSDSQKAIFHSKFKVNWKDVDVSRLCVPVPEDKQIPGKDANQKYLSCNAEYITSEDVDSETPIYEEFRMEGPIMYSRYGITHMEDEKTHALSYSIYSPLPVSKDPEAKAFVDKLDEIYARMSDYVEEYRVKLGRATFKAEGAEAAGISKLYKYKKDKASGEYHTDRDPHIYNKLTTGFNKTVFVGLDGSIIPWKKLEEVEMKFVPIYSLGLYKGGVVIAYPFKVVEAVVLFFRQTNATSSQQDTVEKLKEEYLREYQQSIEAMSKVTLESGDGLTENKSTLGDVGDPAPPSTSNAITHEPDPEPKEEDKEEAPVPASRKAPPRGSLAKKKL